MKKVENFYMSLSGWAFDLSVWHDINVIYVVNLEDTKYVSIHRAEDLLLLRTNMSEEQRNVYMPLLQRNVSLLRRSRIAEISSK